MSRSSTIIASHTRQLIANVSDEKLASWVDLLTASQWDSLAGVSATRSANAPGTGPRIAPRRVAKPKAEPVRKPRAAKASDDDVASVVAAVRKAGTAKAERLQGLPNYKAALARAVNAGLLTKSGKARGTVYEAAESNGSVHAS